MSNSDVIAVREALFRALSRREHSQKELINKLSTRFAVETIQQVLDGLTQEGLQSDQRFCEMYIRYKSNNGYGPRQIRMQLAQKGVASELIEQEFTACDIDWYTLASEVRQRKFGETLPQDFKLKAKQMRFLQYRGFESEQIQYAISP